jgi:hypothetical protein
MNLKPTNQNLYSQRANEFRKRRGWKRYMMVPNETLEREMLDPVLPNEIRILYAIRRYSWGNLSDYAVADVWLKDEERPRPLTQKQIGEKIGIANSTANDSVSLLKKAGYLKTDHPYLYPLDKCGSLESDTSPRYDPSEPDSDSLFLRFRSFLAKKGVEQAIIVDQLAEKRKQYQEQAAKISAEMKEHEKWLWTQYRSYKRGKNPFGFNDPGNTPGKVA